MTNEEFNREVVFTHRKIDAAYINSLVDLVNACDRWHVEVDKVFAFQNGWVVTFVGFEGDAICHDGSYGSPCRCGLIDDSVHTNDWSKSGHWETIGFPWDNEDVSVHSAEWLAYAISRLRDGCKYDESWEVMEL